jgi:hypothetical protein
MTRRAVRRLAWLGVALCVVALALGVTEPSGAPLVAALDRVEAPGARGTQVEYL